MAVGQAFIPEVLEYWFGTSDPGARVPARMEMWFNGGEDVDAHLRARFSPVLDGLCAGQGEAWLSTPGGRLAYVIVLDQFSRGIWRGSPRAFAQDPRALAAALEGIELGADRVLGLHQRAFLYLPLEHSEDPRMQARSVLQFQRLHDDAPPEDRAAAAAYLDYAQRHKDVIDRFGRYPHRNGALGRTTTSEEFAYLRKPGGGF